VIEQIKKLSYNTRVLSQMLGREPSVNELAKVLGLSEGKIHLLQGHMNKEPISINNLKQEKHIEESNDD
jgi:DNA-directed RNA polymerase specialized sigma subunit